LEFGSSRTIRHLLAIGRGARCWRRRAQHPPSPIAVSPILPVLNNFPDQPFAILPACDATPPFFPIPQRRSVRSRTRPRSDR
jgi:hypothetical protein